MMTGQTTAFCDHVYAWDQNNAQGPSIRPEKKRFFSIRPGLYHGRLRYSSLTLASLELSRLCLFFVVYGEHSNDFFARYFSLAKGKRYRLRVEVKHAQSVSVRCLRES